MCWCFCIRGRFSEIPLKGYSLARSFVELNHLQCVLHWIVTSLSSFCVELNLCNAIYKAFLAQSCEGRNEARRWQAAVEGNGTVPLTFDFFEKENSTESRSSH